MSTHAKRARFPFGGYRVKFEKLGTMWRFVIINKLNAIVHKSPLIYKRQEDCRPPAREFKAALVKREVGS